MWGNVWVGYVWKEGNAFVEEGMNSRGEDEEELSEKDIIHVYVRATF